jgi:DNA repair protein RadD
MKLRDYQRAAIDGVYKFFEEAEGNPLVVVPTGGGKSVIAARFIQEVCETWSEERILVVTHVKELIAQNHAALLRCWPDAPAGIYSAGLNRRDTSARIMFCGVQSIYSRVAQLGHFDIVIVDEAHLIPAKGFGMYRTMLEGLRAMNPKVRMVGLTATPYRTDSGNLDEGDDRLFHGVAYSCDIPQMIDDGYLSPITNRGVRAEIDTRAVRTRAGEYRRDELEEVATAGDLVRRSVDELLERSGGRKSWLIFACGVKHAEMIADELTERGVINACVFGHTSHDDRDRYIAAFKAGDITAMINVGVLTTGFDAPQTDLIALMRPTQSAGLYVQMVGRGLRIAPGKEDCLILDFGTNVQRHGPINEVNPKQPGTGGEPPMKKCPGCMAIVYTATTVCPSCGHVWETKSRTPGHDLNPDEISTLVSRGKSYERWPVREIEYTPHDKPGKPMSMRVTYHCGKIIQKRISEWVCFSHGGYAGEKAAKWWLERGGNLPVPANTRDALVRINLEGEPIQMPIALKVDISGGTGRWPQIKGVTMPSKEAR